MSLAYSRGGGVTEATTDSSLRPDPYPVGKVHRTPKALHWSEPAREQFFVPSCGDRHQHSLLDKPLAIDLLRVRHPSS